MPLYHVMLNKVKQLEYSRSLAALRDDGKSLGMTVFNKCQSPAKKDSITWQFFHAILFVQNILCSLSRLMDNSFFIF